MVATSSDGPPPSFWAHSIPAGATLRQHIPRGCQLVLTAAGIPICENSLGRSVLKCSSGGNTDLVLCNLFGSQHGHITLSQPFNADVTFVADGKSAIHVSGYIKGDVRIAELDEHRDIDALEPEPATAPAAAPAATKPKPQSVTTKASTQASSGTIAANSKAMKAEALLDVEAEDSEGEGEDSGDEEDEDEDEGEEEDSEDEEDDDENEGEEEGEGESGEESEEESEDETGGMPLAPPALEAILRAGLKQKPGTPSRTETAEAKSKRSGMAGSEKGLEPSRLAKRRLDDAQSEAATSKAAKAAKASKADEAAQAVAAKAAEAKPKATEGKMVEAKVSAPPKEFEPCKKFSGPREGFVFKKGERGVGYYIDKKPVVRVGKGAALSPGTKGGLNATSPVGMKTLPNGLKYEDLAPGNGPIAQKGRKVRVKYVGKLTNGKTFDSGTIAFKLGGGEVIKGWDLGVAGMKVGGRRTLKIPPTLGYGHRGAPPDIPPNATLVFEVSLLSC